MAEGDKLFSIGNFLVLVVSGAIIPLLLVLYKSRCKSICWGCITRDVLPPAEEKEEKKPVNNNISNNNNATEEEPATESNDK